MPCTTPPRYRLLQTQSDESLPSTASAHQGQSPGSPIDPSQVQLRNPAIPQGIATDGSSGSNAQLLQFLLAQQQLILQQQFRSGHFHSGPPQSGQPHHNNERQHYSPSASPTHGSEHLAKDDELEELRERLRQSKLFADDLSRQNSDLLKFKEAASSHLRAQNLTIKRLTSKGGPVGVSPPPGGGGFSSRIMERLRDSEVKRASELRSSKRRSPQSKARHGSPPFIYTSK